MPAPLRARQRIERPPQAQFAHLPLGEDRLTGTDHRDPLAPARFQLRLVEDVDDATSRPTGTFALSQREQSGLP